MRMRMRMRMRMLLLLLLLLGVVWVATGLGSPYPPGLAVVPGSVAKPNSVAVADLDGDGDLDVLSTASISGTVCWLNNTGQGETWVLGGCVDQYSAFSVAAGDLNGDGLPDPVVGVYQEHTVLWSVNRVNVPGGSVVAPGSLVTIFTHPLPTSDTAWTRQVQTGQIDSDGSVDVLSAYGTNGGATHNTGVWLHANTAGDGSVWSHTEVTGGLNGEVTRFALLDIDKDGSLDVAWVWSSRAFPPASMGLYVSLNTAGDGSVWSTTQHGQANAELQVAAGDVTGDVAGTDVVFSHDAYLTLVLDVLNATGARDSLTLTRTLAPKTVTRLMLGDVNGDAAADIVAAVQENDAVTIMYNADGRGTVWTESAGISTVLFGPKGAALVDMNGDGALDVVVADEFGDQILCAFNGPWGGSASGLVSTAALEVPSVSTGLAFDIQLGLSDGSPYVLTNATINAVDVIVPSAVATLGKSAAHPPAAGIVSVWIDGPFAPGQRSIDVRVSGAALADSPITMTAVLYCPGGSVAVDGLCTPCLEGTFDPTGVSPSSSCEACPLQAVTAGPGSIALSNCSCVAGTWTGEPGSSLPQFPSCVACPVGGVCEPGTATPVAGPGFFASEADGSAFAACKRDGCLGNNRCAAGYRGYMCATCAEGYASVNARECVRCDAGRLGVFAVVAVGVLAATGAAIAYVGWSVRSAQSKTGDEFRRRRVPVSVSLVIVAVQMVGLFVAVDARWTKSSATVLRVFSASVIDPKTLGSECALGSFAVTYVVFVTLPLLMLGVVALGAWAWIGGSLTLFAESTLFGVGPLLYIPLTQSVLVIFDCVALPDGRFVLDSDNGQTCFDGAWIGLAIVGSIVMLGYVIGLPAYFAARLTSHRGSLFEPRTMQRFGSLYRNWRNEYFFGEVLFLVKRLVVVLLVIFASSAPLAQIVLVAAVVLLDLWAFLRVRPLFCDVYNTVEARLSASILAVLVMGYASYLQRDGTSDMVLSLGTIGALTILFGISVHAIATDIVSILK